MAETWLEEAEVSDPFGDAESDWEYFDGGAESLDLESEDGEASAAARRRKARQVRSRRLELQRKREAQAREARRRGVPARRGGAPTAQAAAAAIRQVDLESKVQGDAVRSALAAQDKRIDRAQAAAVAGVLAGQIQNSFTDVFDNVFARAALSFAPLLLLSPRKKGTGVTALAYDPRVVGGALVAGVVIAGQLRDRGTVVQQVRITAPPRLTVGQSATFLADVLDSRGVPIPNRTVVWSTSNPSVATVDAATGQVTAVAVGFATITATADSVVGRVVLEVVAPSK